jgi:hypothetical protein
LRIVIEIFFEGISRRLQTILLIAFRILAALVLAIVATSELSFQELLTLTGLGGMASLFGEFRYSREAAERQMDALRIFDRTLEWGCLATAGYIIVSALRTP